MGVRRAAVRGWHNLRDVQLRLTGKYPLFRRVADGMERGDFVLTKEQALVKAYDENPDLYARARRHQLRSGPRVAQ